MVGRRVWKEGFPVCGKSETKTEILGEMLKLVNTFFSTGYPLLDTGDGGALRTIRSIDVARIIPQLKSRPTPAPRP